MTPDVEFANACVARKLINADRANRAFAIQKLLASNGIHKSMPELLVDALWVAVPDVELIAADLRRNNKTVPPIRPSSAPAKEFESLHADDKKKLETLAAALAQMGFVRGAASLAADRAAAPRVPVRTKRAETKPRARSTLVRTATTILFAIALPAGAFVVLKALRTSDPIPPPPPPPVVVRPPPPPAPPPEIAPSPTATAEPTREPTLEEMMEKSEEERKKFMAQAEVRAADIYKSGCENLKNGNPYVAKRKFVILRDEYGWTEFVKGMKGDLAKAIASIDAGNEFAPPPAPEPAASTGLRNALVALTAESVDIEKWVRAVRTKFKNERVDVALRTGEVRKGVTIVDFTRDDLVLATGPLAWDALDDASFAAVQKLIAKPGAAIRRATPGTIDPKAEFTDVTLEFVPAAETKLTAFGVEVPLTAEPTTVTVRGGWLRSNTLMTAVKVPGTIAFSGPAPKFLIVTTREVLDPEAIRARLEKNPEDAGALAQQGELRYRRGDLALAQMDLELSRRLAPNARVDWLLRHLRGPSAFGLGKESDAWAAKLAAAFNTLEQKWPGVKAPRVRLVVCPTRDAMAAYGSAGPDEIVMLDVPETDVMGHAVRFMLAGVPDWFVDGAVEALGTRLTGTVLVSMKPAVKAASWEAVVRKPSGDLLCGWAAAKFLLEAHGPKVAAYIAAAKGGKDATAAYDAAFGDEDSARLQAEWRIAVDLWKETP